MRRGTSSSSRHRLLVVSVALLSSLAYLCLAAETNSVEDRYDVAGDSVGSSSSIAKSYREKVLRRYIEKKRLRTAAEKLFPTRKRGVGQQQQLRLLRVTDRLPRTLQAIITVPPELMMDTPELLRRHQYPVEEHFVTTKDGYILGLHRIPGPRFSSPPSPPPHNDKVVLLMHGLFSTSNSFVLGGPGYALGLLLADAGYDVWLGNFRGNTYSRNHTSLNPDRDLRFWQFSQDEMAEHDLPSLADYVRSSAGVDKIFYIGYSQGSRVAFMTASLNNGFVDKIRLLVAIASTGARQLEGSRSLFSDIIASSWRALEGIGLGEMKGSDVAKTNILYWLCNENSLFNNLCSSTVTYYFAEQSDRVLLRREQVPVLLTSLQGGGSIRQFSHLNQLTRGVFHKFDLGPFDNVLKYGSKQPPLYNMATITCPTALFWAPNDPFTPEKDVDRIMGILPNVVKNYKVPHPYFNHIDFVSSTEAKELVYDELIRLLEQF